MVFQKRDSSTEKEILTAIGNGHSSSNNKPSFSRQTSKIEFNNLHSESKSQPATEPTSLEKTQSLPTSETSVNTLPKSQDSIEKVSPTCANEKGVSNPTIEASKLNYFAGGWKPSSPFKDTVGIKPSTNETRPSESNLADKVKKNF